MGDRLRKPTASYRATVMPAPGRVLVPPEEGADAGAVRRVQISLPQGAQVGLMVDEMPDEVTSLPFKWPEPPMGRFFTLHLLPEQFVSAMAHRDYVEVSVFIEYLG